MPHDETQVIAIRDLKAETEYERAVERLAAHRSQLRRSAADLETHFKTLPKRTIGDSPYKWIAGAFAVGFLLGWK